MANETAPDFLAAARTDEELMERIGNRQNYMPETIEASLKELHYRGKQFSDEEMKGIWWDLKECRARVAELKGSAGLFDNDYKATIVKDPDAPQMYTPVAIYLFTILISPFLGSIMMAMNISKTGKESAVVGAVVFGIGCTIVQLWLAFNVEHFGYVTLIFGIANAYALNHLFWKPYIGFNNFYRARPVWVPLIIVIILFVLFMMLYNPNGSR